jgi:DNA-binding NarL/FixJ family response regulator
MPRSIEIVIADDQLAVRRGVELLLREAGLRVAGVSAGAAEASRLLVRRRYDVALVEAVLDGTPSASLLAAAASARAASSQPA